MSDMFKDLVYEKEDVIQFPAGIPGFDKNKEFVIVSIPEYMPFEWLAATDGSGLRFAIINPMIFRPDYAPNIIKEQLEELEIKKPEDILLFAIVTIRENPEESTANLIGPVIINKTKRIGKQIIIEDDKYSTKESILGKK